MMMTMDANCRPLAKNSVHSFLHCDNHAIYIPQHSVKYRNADESSFYQPIPNDLFLVLFVASFPCPNPSMSESLEELSGVVAGKIGSTPPFMHKRMQ